MGNIAGRRRRNDRPADRTNQTKLRTTRSWCLILRRGQAAPFVETIREADLVVLAADPTRFGLHDLKLSVHLCRSMNIDPVVVLNRSGIGDTEQFRNWCRSQGLLIAAEIPNDRNIAEFYSKGLLPTDKLEYLKELFDYTTEKLLALSGSDTERGAPDAVDSLETMFFKPSPAADKVDVFETPTNLNEITVISGKGGTGKTSLSACFTQLRKKPELSIVTLTLPICICC